VAFDIDDAETERLIQVLAERRGVSTDEAIKSAVRNELQRDLEQGSLWERLQPLQDRVAAWPSTGLEADKAFYDSLNEE
jgi:antitoxin VapB